jgi:hypothetical protein
MLMVVSGGMARTGMITTGMHRAGLQITGMIGTGVQRAGIHRIGTMLSMAMHHGGPTSRNMHQTIRHGFHSTSMSRIGSFCWTGIMWTSVHSMSCSC